MLNRFALGALFAGALLPRPTLAQTVRLPATASIWLSDSNDHERHSSSGKVGRFKLKSVQEMAAVRFDAAPARARLVRSARLFLHRVGDDQLRYIRLSTVNGDWEQGNATTPYSPGDGATYLLADARANRPWSWSGSCFADVIMSSGNSLADFAERKSLDAGWISVAVAPRLVEAMIAGDTDGLAIMDGGTIALHNNMIDSAESGRFAPYIEADLAPAPLDAPPAPALRATPAPESAHLGSGALRIELSAEPGVFCWKIALDGKPVSRWQVAHPAEAGATVFTLDDLLPSHAYQIEVTAVAPSGRASAPTRLSASSSPALAPPPALGPIRYVPSRAPLPPQAHDGRLEVWAVAGSVKISPETGKPLAGEMEDGSKEGNAVWNGGQVRLSGARGEYVSFQLCLENAGDAPLAGVKMEPAILKDRGGATIGRDCFELYRDWYARNGAGVWQPAYLEPIRPGEAMQIPDPRRGLARQRNQAVTVELYIPPGAAPGDYAGAIDLSADGVKLFSVPLRVRVFHFELPRRLSFRPELNAYQIPKDALDYYRLAQQHRCTLNCWRWDPALHGSGKAITVDWTEYDRTAGQLLSGEAFKANRRAGVPVECMYLPFIDNWPTNLTPANYRYAGHWPGRGEKVDSIVRHYLDAPPIAEALSDDYKAAFLSVERQFIEHFAAKGWNQTQMQCFFGGKNTHRIAYGSNYWWTTDEPMHWNDWLALQYFDRLWTQGRGKADERVWAARADISRPQWMGTTLDGAVNVVYFGAGAFSSPDNDRRCRTIARRAPLELMTYGSCNADTKSNLRCQSWALDAWLNGANAILPWQTLGPERSLDDNDAAAGGGNALLVPGARLGAPVVADLRLDSLRDAEQLVEYLVLASQRRNLNREQLRFAVGTALNIETHSRPGASADDADALRAADLKDWQIAALRERLAEWIEQ